MLKRLLHQRKLVWSRFQMFACAAYLDERIMRELQRNRCSAPRYVGFYRKLGFLHHMHGAKTLVDGSKLLLQRCSGGYAHVFRLDVRVRMQ